MASLAVQPALAPAPAEPADLAPADGRARRSSPGEAGASSPRDRVSISPAARRRAASGKVLDAAQEREVEDLAATDQKVRSHERAHQAAAGGAAGAATFDYAIGPDGKAYAVAGEVPLRIQLGRTPEEKVAAARRMRAAALAPADPSAQDLAVAAEAATLEIAALLEKAAQASARVDRARTARRASAAYAAQAAQPP